MEQEERFIAIETRMAYLENFITELNQVVIEQGREIKKLTSETNALKRQMAEKKEKLPENERPPHY